MSKDLKPKQRLGQTRLSKRKRILIWSLVAACGIAGAFAAFRYTGSTEVDVAVARVRRGDFVVSVKTRGEIRSVRSVLLTAPQVPDPQIVKLAESGRPIKKGDVVVAFDGVQQEQNLIEKSTDVRTADSEIVQTKAQHKIDDEMDGMNLTQSEYNVERAKLEASKAEILSEIEGAKDRIDVGVSEGELGQVKTQIESRKISHSADMERLDQKKDKTVRDTELAKGYLSKMVIRAPNDGIVNILPNFRAGGSFGQSPPPFKEGDRVWTGAAIAEIPDLSEMRVELKLEEVDRGRLKLGQPVHVRVDAVPEKEFARGNGLDQPDRHAGVPHVSAREAVSGAGYAQESGPAASSGHERLGRDHRREAARRAADPIARQFSEKRQADGLRSKGPAVPHAHHRGRQAQ